MQVLLVYFITIFLSNTVGALSGMSGDVIIKPVLDFLGFHSLGSVAFYSSITVFVMSISSTCKQYQNGVQIEWKKAASISFGSLVGGMLGDSLPSQAIALAPSGKKAQLIQYIIMLLTLVLVLLYNQFSNWHSHPNGLSIFLIVGLGLGILSTFLGIGNGPTNVTCLILFFGVDVKSATVYPIAIIFFSQLAKLGNIGLATGFAAFDLTMLQVIIPAALFGGYVGSLFSKELSQQRVAQIYSLVVFLVILLDMYNLWTVI